MGGFNGRREQRTAEQRAAIVEAFRRSGLSLRRFAQLSGIGYNTLWVWLKQAGVKLRASSPKSPRLLRTGVALPVVVTEPTSAAADVLCVALGNGVSIQVACAAQASLAALLIKALNSSSRHEAVAAPTHGAAQIPAQLCIINSGRVPNCTLLQLGLAIVGVGAVFA